MISAFDWTLEWSRQKKISTWSMPQMPSTNLAAKEWAFGPIPPPQLFITESQTAGRGRGENSWESTPGSLFSSWIIEMGLAPQPVLVPMAGLAVYRAAKEIWPKLNWALKAPNDIYIGEKKIGGLLVEVITRQPTYRIVIGFGMNLGSAPAAIEMATALEPELNKIGESLTKETFHKFLSQLWDEFQEAARFGFLLIMPPNVCEELKDALNARPGQKEKVVKVSEEGNLVLRTDTHEKNIAWHEL